MQINTVNNDTSFLSQLSSNSHDDSTEPDSINITHEVIPNTRTPLINTSRRTSRSASNQPGGISWYFAVFLIVNAALGGGLLNFAKAYNEAGGILVSTLIQLLLVVFITGALVILGYCTDKQQSSNFQDVVYSVCGKSWQTINSMCIILYMFGCCITFFIIIGDQLDQIFNCIAGPSYVEYWYFDRKFTITVSSIAFILPLCYAKRIDFLTYPSMFAVIAIVYIVILIPIKYAHTNTKNVIIKTRPENWTDVFSVLPVICFGYQCHVNAVPIYACLKKKNLNEYIKSVIVSMVIVFAAYTISATYGYLTFGIKVNDDLLKSYDSNDVSVLIAIVMFLIKTYTSYPLNLFCARTAIEGLWIEIFHLNSNSILHGEPKRRTIIVTLWFIISLFIAIFIPNISIVIRYMGALAATFMFIFPGLCFLFNSANESYNENVNQSLNLCLISSVYITTGVFIMGLVITQSLCKDFNFIF